MLKRHQKQTKVAQDTDPTPAPDTFHSYVAPEIEVIDIELGINILANSTVTTPSEGEEWS